MNEGSNSYKRAGSIPLFIRRAYFIPESKQCYFLQGLCAPGGRGLPGSFRVLLYYYHPPHNFFCNIAPFMGRCLHMVIMGCKSHATHYWISPRPPHSMASDRGYLFVVCKEGVLGFYVVTKQAIKVTRGSLKPPPHYLLRKSY